MATVLIAACTTSPPEQPTAPLNATRLLDLELMPPIYELMMPSRPAHSMLGLQPSPEVVSARLVPPSLQDWDVALPQALYQTGQASWYGDKFHGRLTANGERYNMHALTAAHPTLPFGTEVCVRGLLTKKEVLVRVNDRGPFAGRRIIDLSRGAAERLGMLSQGLKHVSLWIPGEDGPPCGNGQVALQGRGKASATP